MLEKVIYTNDKFYVVRLANGDIVVFEITLDENIVLFLATNALAQKIYRFKTDEYQDAAYGNEDQFIIKLANIFIKDVENNNDINRLD